MKLPETEKQKITVIVRDITDIFRLESDIY